MLKNILSLLLSKFYSKQESELVGHQAMPSASNTVITPSIKTECTTWSDAHIGIAPADGYLYVTGRTTNTDGFLQISSDTTEIAATTFGNTDKDNRLLFPLAKGQAMKVTAKSLKNIFLRFSSSIGGGVSAFKNALLQGGGLCLSHWYSSLRRSSLLAKRNGSEVKVFSQTQIPEQRSLLTTLRLSFIRLQVMDGLHSAETGHRSMSALPESWERVALTLKVISELQLRFGRGIPLVSIARRTISNRLRQNSFLAKGQRSTSLVGGASC